MSTALENRYDFVFLFDVQNGNPNGDPDAGNLPRVDPDTGHGLVTDVCLKRKVRNFIDLSKDGAQGYNIYVREKAVLSTARAPAYAAVESKAKTEAEKVQRAQKWMCDTFYDVRAFGAVMSTRENNCGQVRGPVQFTFATSVDPIQQMEVSITRMAVETEKEAENQKGDNRTMGRKNIVPYGLYRMEGFVSAPLAARTGFSEDDLDALWQSLINMFEHDRSAARGLMSARKLFVFRHENKMGNAPAHKLFDLVEVKRTSGDLPPRSFTDYQITVRTEAKPAGVDLLEKL